MRSIKGNVVSQWLCPSATIVLAAIVACTPLLWYGAPNGDSIVANLVWSQNFAAQLAQGELYPRWLMNMSHGAGSPVFYFYAPLPFYIEALAAALVPSGNPMIKLAWGEWLLLALSGLTFLRYARQRFNVVIAAAGAILYMILPYHFEINLWRRQDLGELTNYIWMPFVLHYAERLLDDRRALIGLAVSYALMLVSHIPSTLLFSLCLIGYVGALAPFTTLLRRLPLFVGAIALAVGLSAIYWVPALFAEQYVRVEALWTPYYDFHRWFFPIDPYRFDGDSHALQFLSRICFVIGVSTSVFTLCSLSSLWWRIPAVRRQAMACLLLIATAWFLMSSWSVFFWEHFPELPKVQFPWRVAVVVDLAVAVTALHLGEALYRRRDLLAAAAVVASLMLLGWTFATANLANLLDPFMEPGWTANREAMVARGFDTPEYQTVWNPAKDLDEGSATAAERGRLVYDQTGGEVSVTQWHASAIELRSQLIRSSTVMVRQYFFPNWRATVDDGNRAAVLPSRDNGLIVIDLPAGSHRVELKQGPLIQEQIGTAVSAATIGLLLGWSWLRRRSVFHFARMEVSR